MSNPSSRTEVVLSCPANFPPVYASPAIGLEIRPVDVTTAVEGSTLALVYPPVSASAACKPKQPRAAISETKMLHKRSLIAPTKMHEILSRATESAPDVLAFSKIWGNGC